MSANADLRREITLLDVDQSKPRRCPVRLVLFLIAMVLLP
jgi:hypothetical protein